MPCDAPSSSIPADINRHTDAELGIITAEDVVFLAFDEDSQETDVLVLGGDCSLLMLRGSDGFLRKHTKVFPEFQDSFWSPFDLPEFFWLVRWDTLPIITLDIRVTEFLQQVSGQAKSDAEFFFFHYVISYANAVLVNYYQMVGVEGLEPST